MHDGIIFERHGIPAAPIATDQFVNMGRASAEAQGLPDYPFAVIEHPISRLGDDDLRRKAEAALPRVVELLLS